MSLLAVLSPQLGAVGALGEVVVTVTVVPRTPHACSLEGGGGCRREKGDWSPYTGLRALRGLAGMYNSRWFRGSATTVGGFLLLSSRAQQ